VDFKKLQAQVGSCCDLVASFHNPKRKKGGNGSSGGTTTPPTPPTTANVVLDLTPPAVILEVINFEASSDAQPTSPEPTMPWPQPHTSTVIKSSSSSQSSRVVGPSPRLDHMTIIVPGLQSNWHVNMKAKDLLGVYAHDAELMEKLDLEGCLDSGEVMLRMCSAIIQHFRVAARV